MKSRLCSLSLLALFFAGVAGLAGAPTPVAFRSFDYAGRDTVFESPLPTGDYRNPILAGFYPDPSVCRVGRDFFLINSSFAYFPGIPIFHSRDLVHWTQLGHVIDRPSQLNYDKLGVSRGIFAPALSFHDGTFYVICTMVDSGGNFVVTARNPAGPWSDPTWLDFEGIDPSLFFDDDGRAWVVNNGGPEGTPLYSGHRAIWLQQFDPASKKLIGPRSVLVNGGVDLAKKPVWIEGPHLYKRNGWYYLCCAEGGTAEDHSEVVFRSKSVTGPFVPWDHNPILTQRDLDGTAPHAVTSTGHADLVIGPDGNWWSVFLGCRPFGGKYYATGRETFMLPVTWTDAGWPVILPPGKRVPYVVPGPRMPDGRRSAEPPFVHPGATPLTGNFTWRDDFSTRELSPLWITLRAPHTPAWSVDPVHGLRLMPSADRLSGTGHPAFLARRLQHARFDASTRLSVPAETDISAGLVIFQSETHHFFLGVRRTPDATRIFVEEVDGQAPTVLATATIPLATSELGLKVTGDEKILSFLYATDPGTWKVLVNDADATVITTQAAGGFVGAVIGLHARIEPQ